MTGSHADLKRECRVFSAYLGVGPPSEYVIGKYIQAHDRIAGLTAGDRFDAVLIGLGARHPVLTKIVDAYARLFVPLGALRNKLVLLLAILETSAPDGPAVFPRQARGWMAVTLQIALQSCLAAASALIGVIVLSPVHVALRISKRTA